MSDSTDDTTPGNVIDFGRRTGRTGFTITPPTSLAGAGVTGPVIPPQPAGEPTSGTRTPAGRRSPLDTVAALPSTTLTTAPVVVTHPDGGLPDTFRSPGTRDGSGPRLGALSLAATLAVAVAALRGSCILLEDWRQRRMARAAESAPLREARAKHRLAPAQARFSAAETHAKNAAAASGAGGATQRRSKRTVPDSHTFGQKTLGHRTGPGGGGGGGKGKGGGTGTGTTAARTDHKHNNHGGTGRGLGGGGTHRKHDTPLKHRPGTDHRATKDHGGTHKKGPKSPHRGSQGAGPVVKKHSDGRTRLPEALKNDTSKAARKRLERRRKDLDSPALWAAGDRSKPKSKDLEKRQAVDLAKDPTKNSAKDGTDQAGRRKKDRRKPDMSKLRDAFWHDTKASAAGRWARRHGDLGTPPLWKSDKKRQRREKKAEEAKANSPRSPKAAKSGAGGERWRRARDRARAAWAGRAAGGGSAGTSRGSNGPRTGEARGSAGAGPRTGGRSGRRSPFENAGQTGATTWTVEREDYVGAQAKRWQPDALDQGHAALTATGQPALPPAREAHTRRPGTTRPKEPIPMPPAPVPARDPRLQKARRMAERRSQAVTRQARHMDAQHATEITLDDALDEYGDFKDDAFTTHEQSAKLAGRARQLAATLEAFAAELATRNNLIGALFTGTMANLSEDMELVARMSDEMEDSSLEAAEGAEQADNDLNDAYRPISQATADAGLTTPSAPVHNQT
ncbi:hypothetical protein ABZ829_27805 [Streptomyces xanthochromogenes]|uniref:hypothetical protein n=1 Tax=Streptomyces xanthochromogenes TaxID=67384 RepID=UPI0034187F88